MDEKLSDFDDNFIVFNENAEEVLFMIRLYTSTHTHKTLKGVCFMYAFKNANTTGILKARYLLVKIRDF